jgi:DNA-binding NtrC family response regulator
MAARALRRPTILAVDDEPGLREVFRLALEHAYDVLEASDGPTALDIVASRRVDLALLDVRMPGMDGLSVLAQMKERARDLKVIVITAVDGAQTAVEAMKLGAVDYITKPVSITTLVPMVGSALATTAAKPDASAARLLVVGSDIGTRATLATLLATRSDVVVTSVAWERVYAAARAGADLAVVDVPRLDEADLRLIRHLRRRLPAIPWVLMAPPTHADDLTDALAGAARTILPKPVTLAALLAEIAAILPRSASDPAPALSAECLRVVEHARDAYGTATVDGLARGLGVPAARLSRLLRDETGLTAKQYLTRLRVEAAKCLLVETDDGLQPIARRVGLWDASHLSRLFREQTGHAPGEYRKVQRADGFVH